MRLLLAFRQRMTFLTWLMAELAFSISDKSVEDVQILFEVFRIAIFGHCLGGKNMSKRKSYSN